MSPVFVAASIVVEVRAAAYFGTFNVTIGKQDFDPCVRRGIAALVVSEGVVCRALVVVAEAGTENS